MTTLINPIAEFIGSVHLGPRQFHKSLSVWPLIGQIRQGLDYISLPEAMEKGSIIVEEVSAGGQVPNVRVQNRGDLAVLILFGEEIVGAKQNRVANASFLVGPKSKVLLDVTCVEQGRWSAGKGAPFAAEGSVLSHSIRSKMQTQVAAARASFGTFAADQGEVWDEVSHRIRGSQTRSATGSYQDYAQTRRSECEEIIQAFRPLPDQVGFVVAIHDDVVALEAIGKPEVFARVLPGLLRSYAIDAVDWTWLKSQAEAEAAFDAPEPFLEAIAEARVDRARSLGLGDDLRLEGARVAGCALDSGGIVHLTAFARQAERAQPSRRWWKFGR